MVLLYHLLVHGVIGCLSVFALLCCFMSSLLRFLLFDVFYGLYSGGVSVFSDVVLLFVDTPMVLYGDLYHMIHMIDTFASQKFRVSLFSFGIFQIPTRQVLKPTHRNQDIRCEEMPMKNPHAISPHHGGFSHPMPPCRSQHGEMWR